MSFNKFRQTKDSFISLKANAKVGGAIDKILNSAFVQQDIITPLEKLGEFIAGAVDCSKFLDMTQQQQDEIKQNTSVLQQPCKGLSDVGAYIGVGIGALAGDLLPVFSNIALLKANLQDVEKIAETEVPQAFKDKAMKIVDVTEKFGENFLKLFHCYKQIHDQYESNHEFGPAWKEGFNCAKGNMEEVGDMGDAVLNAAYDFMFELNEWALKEYGAANLPQHGGDL